MIVLDIPDVPPSLNKVLRMHWSKKSRLALDWAWKARIAFDYQNSSILRIGKKQVKITLHHSRMYDKDNAYGSCKVLVDCLRGLKVIQDDTAEWLELTVEQARCPHKQRHTIIEISAAVSGREDGQT